MAKIGLFYGSTSKTKAAEAIEALEGTSVVALHEIAVGRDLCSAVSSAFI